MKDNNLDKIETEVTEDKMFILDRVEGGIGVIEVVENNDVTSKEVVNANIIPDERYGDGVVLEVSDSGEIVGFDHHTTAKRQRGIHRLIQEMKD